MLNILATLAVRCLLVALFLPFSAADKILNFSQAVDQAEEAVPNRGLATMLIVGGFAIETVMSAAILTGFADRFAALVLAAYCLATAFLWKRFWNEPDFRLKGARADRALYWDFLKNLAMAGGFLVLTFGSDAAGVRRFLAAPLASSHPYEIAAHER